MLSFIKVTGDIGAGSIVSAVAAIVAAWIARGNHKVSKEVKNETAQINAAVNNVPPGQQSIATNVQQIVDKQTEDAGNGD